MGSLKAPGHDGFLGFFFQKHWEVMGDDVCSTVCDFFNCGFLLKELNNNHIALILKVKNPKSISQFYPIGL